MPAVSGTDTAPLLFSIDDTGIGIPPQKLDLIFDSFAQADESINKKFGGVGLGLSISRELIELMGGRIWVRSQVGSGGAFSFTVPLPEARLPRRHGEARAQRRARASAADPARRRLAAQPPRRDRASREDQRHRRRRRERQGSRSSGESAPLRSRVDGRADARDGRRGSDRRHPSVGAGGAPPAHADCRAHRARDGGRCGAKRAGGCDEHVTKPVRKQTLLERLDEYRAAPAEEIP